MGILQSGVNQALGMVSGTVAGIKTMTTLKKGVDTQEEMLKQAQKKEAEEHAYQQARTQRAEAAAAELTKPLEESAGTTEDGVPRITPALARERVYTAEQLEKHYLESMDYKKAAAMRQQQVGYGEMILGMERAREQAQEAMMAQQTQQAQTQERYKQFVNMFTEGGRYR